MCNQGKICRSKSVFVFQNTMSSKHDKVLTVLSYITCSISMMSAFVAIIIFHILRYVSVSTLLFLSACKILAYFGMIKSMLFFRLTSNRISIHKHLAVNIFLTQLVFLIASHFTSTKVSFCLLFRPYGNRRGVYKNIQRPCMYRVMN